MDPHGTYAIAHKIDDLTNKFIGDHPLNSETVADWQLFIRTVQSSLNMMQHAIDQAKWEHEIGWKEI